MKQYDVIVIGGGPAGLAAAISAYDNGCKDVLLIERDNRLGGILNQCIHNGFGLHTFKEELTGPEYADRFIREFHNRNIDHMTGTMVIEITPDKTVRAVNSTDGLIDIKAKAVILAMGCRERSRGQLSIPGSRPAGIFSAGTAQRLVNLEGQMPGRRVVILGSGDIGLIMARRMTLEGANVLAVVELMPYSGGLKRNIVQCLNDYGIPLYLSHTVINIEGNKRVTAVTVAEVDENRKPVAGTEVRYECDTLLLSCGLIPENELSSQLGTKLSRVTNGPVVDSSLETTIPGVFACGNVLHVHDLVDFVSEEAALAGKNAALYVQHLGTTNKELIPVTFSPEIRYTVPAFINMDSITGDIKVRYRVGNNYQNKKVLVTSGGKVLSQKVRRIMAPGEMEDVLIPADKLRSAGRIAEINIKVTDNG
ncbi:MAG: FAD-dependent oxidoreductase [Clostridiales bacterium]|nr:FAD-dependent oxidoreductase [Clostridiales bacterium]